MEQISRSAGHRRWMGPGESYQVREKSLEKPWRALELVFGV